MSALEGEALCEFLRRDFGPQCKAIRVLDDGSVAAIVKLLYTDAIILGCDERMWSSRFCFEDRARCKQEFDKLKSEDDVPAGWVARR